MCLLQRKRAFERQNVVSDRRWSVNVNLDRWGIETKIEIECQWDIIKSDSSGSDLANSVRKDASNIFKVFYYGLTKTKSDMEGSIVMFFIYLLKVYCTIEKKIA